MEIKNEFNPSEELAEINKLPPKEKKEAVGEFRKKLLDFKKLEVRVQEGLLAAVNKNPESSVAELQEKANEIVGGIGVKVEPEVQKEIGDRIEFYHQIHNDIKNLREQYPDDQDLIQALFGRPPVGKVDVEMKPFYIKIICFDDEDFIYFNYFKPGSPVKITSDDKKKIKSTYGFTRPELVLPEFNNWIVVLRSETQEDKDSLHFAEIHEENHVWHSLLDLSDGAKYIVSINFDKLSTEFLEGRLGPDHFKRLEKHFVFSRRELVEDKLSEEMLCHLKEGKDRELVFNILTSVEAYDYLAKTRKTTWEAIEKLPDGLRETLREIAEKVFITDYRKLIKEGIDVFYVLVDDFNYSPSRAAAFLIYEDLRDWKKVVRRFREDEEKRLYGEYKRGFEHK